MRKMAIVILMVLVPALGVSAKTLTYNQAETVNLRDQGVPADERATNVLVADGNVVYGATSGDKCHVFRFDPEAKSVTVLASIEGPNTVLKGMVLDGDTIYVGTMLTKQQLWFRARKQGTNYDPEDANLIPVEAADNTGRLYRVTGIRGGEAEIEDLGVPVAGQGIHTMALDPVRGRIYGVTSPGGRFFIYDIEEERAQDYSFGRTYTNVSNHRVGGAEVLKELADLTPGEGEWNNRLIPRAMHVTKDGVLYTSGWRGQILKLDPKEAEEPSFSVVDYIPSVPGRQHWNRIDAMVEHEGVLYMGTSDGYVLRLDPATDRIDNFGKPIRAIEVMGLAVSTLDGGLYGVSGGDLEGMPRPWCYNLERGTYEVDIPAWQVIPNRRRIGDVVCTANGTLVASEAVRVGNLWVLTPGEAEEWAKSGVLDEWNPQESHFEPDPDDRFAGHKPIEVDIYPIPSAYHGGSGYTALQADRDGKVYVGTAYYGETARLVQLDPETAAWRCLFRADELTGRYGRGQVPGKIHTKLRLGADGKIYGAMKQGYEQHYSIRADIGEAPEGRRGSQYTCHLFSYDPATDTTQDLGPGWPQEGITAFDVDTDRGYLYGATVPGVHYLVYDLKTKRIWNAGQIAYNHPTRYMPMDPGTGRVYHPGETTPEGRTFMTVWDPEEFRLRDVEVVAGASEEDFTYRHSYATCCGPAGTKTLYGRSGDWFFEMDLDVGKDGKLHVRPLCTVGVDGEVKTSGMYAIERGPDGRIYWTSLGGNEVPMAILAWDPKSETKTYLGSCASAGDYIRAGHSQGVCLDSEGNLAIHVLYCGPSAEQKEQWKVPGDFHYEDIAMRPYYLDLPAHQEGTYYAVYYLRGATAIR